MGTLSEEAILIRDEQKKKANTAQRIGGILVRIANIIDSFNDSMRTISLFDLDSLNSTLASAKGVSFFRAYNVIFDAANNSGFLIVIGDSMGHVVTQLFITHEVLQDNGKFNGTHDHTQLFFYERSFSSESNSWSAWNKTFFSKIQQQIDSLNQNINYFSVVEWSGVTVSNVTIEQSGIDGITPSDIYYDTAKNTFVGKKNDKWYGSFLIIKNYQTSEYSQNSEYEFYRNKFYKGLNGTLWVATDKKTINKLI